MILSESDAESVSVQEVVVQEVVVQEVVDQEVVQEVVVVSDGDTVPEAAQDGAGKEEEAPGTAFDGLDGASLLNE